MVVGDHTNTSEGTESIYHKVKRDWAKMFTTLSLTARNPRPAEDSVSAAVSVMEGNICRVNYKVLPRGWALKQLKGSKPFPPNIKNYPAQVVADMRTARNENGDRLFSRNEWLNATQIKGFFSRMTAKQRRQGRLNSDIVFSTEDVECLEYESERNAQVEEVFGQLAVKHPILYDVYDLCEYYENSKISFWSKDAKRNLQTFRPLIQI